jgi:hypothetical protein
VLSKCRRPPHSRRLLRRRDLVPRLRGLSLGETVRTSAFGPNNADVDEHDVVAQRITSHHYWNDGGRSETWSSPCRYVWPSELDLMGRIAGVALVARWGSWLREPFTGESTSQVSVFGRPAADGGEKPCRSAEMTPEPARA